VVANLSSAAYWIRKLNLINLKAAAPAAAELDTLHFAVRRLAELVAILNKRSIWSPRSSNAILSSGGCRGIQAGHRASVAWRFGLRVAAVVLAVLATILFGTTVEAGNPASREVEHVLNFVSISSAWSRKLRRG
jgi:hypothetical protein